MARTATEIQSEIDDVRSAISAVIKGGQSYTINSGGSSRTVTMADTKFLRSWLIGLQHELAELDDCNTGMMIGPNW